MALGCAANTEETTMSLQTLAGMGRADHIEEVTPNPIGGPLIVTNLEHREGDILHWESPREPQFLLYDMLLNTSEMEKMSMLRKHDKLDSIRRN